MKEHSQGATWPLLCILLCLFVLSVTAPRSWERVARTVPIRLEPDPYAPLSHSGLSPSVAPLRTAALKNRIATEESVLGSAADRVIEPADVASNTLAAGADDDEPLDGPADVLMLAVEETEPSGEIAERHEAAHETKQADLSLEPKLSGSSEVQNGPSTAGTDSVASGSALEDRHDDAWLEPSALLSTLTELGEQDGCNGWAAEASRIVSEWKRRRNLDPKRAGALILQIQQSLRAADELLEELGPDASAVWLRRARYALIRRNALWQRAANTLSAEEIAEPAAAPDPARLAICLANVNRRTRGAAEGASWGKYLLVERLDEVTKAPRSRDVAKTRQIAQRVLRRLDDPWLTAAQRRFVAEDPIAELAAELRHWAAEPVELQQLVARVEEYEQSGRQSAGRAVARDIQSLRWSASVLDQKLGRELDTHYRNCNMRIAVHRNLLHRLLPEQPPREDSVRQRVMGLPVRGRQTTMTDLNIRLTPSQRRLRLTLEVRGRIESSTSVQKGPATLYNDSHSTFLVEKPMEFDLGGIHSSGARVRADSSTQLRSLRTNFDDVPLLGSLVRSEAMRRYDQQRDEACRAVERIVAISALDLFEQDVKAQLDEANQLLDRRVFVPLARLSLAPTVTDFQTTEDRLTIRARLATHDQLGANTPRPRAPTDSLLSVQIHESALNNSIAQLEIAGKTFSARELRLWIGHKLNVADALADESTRDDVWLALAKNDAVTFRFQDGRVEIALAFDWLQKGRRRWRNFEVRVAYRPDPDSDSGELKRDGTIRLVGHGLGGRGQFALRGVFSALFSAERRWRTIPEKLSSDPRLAELSVTQFEIEGGWIGLALAARGVRDKERTARKAHGSVNR